MEILLAILLGAAVALIITTIILAVRIDNLKQKTEHLDHDVDTLIQRIEAVDIKTRVGLSNLRDLRLDSQHSFNLIHNHLGVKTVMEEAQPRRTKLVKVKKSKK